MDESLSRWHEDFHTFHGTQIATVNAMDKTFLKKMRKFIDEIDAMDWGAKCLQILRTKQMEKEKTEEEVDEEKEFCQDCGITVGEMCRKCKPLNTCHYCGGYDGNSVRNSTYPCTIWCTPSIRYIPRWQIRPCSVYHPINCLKTQSFSSGDVINFI